MGSLRLVTTSTVANPNVHDLYLDDSGQLEWIGGDITDTESYARMVAQRITCRVKMIRGEWYLDQRLGTPWKERLWKRGVTVEAVRRVMREVIEGTPGVRELRTLDVELDAASRQATISWTVITEDQIPVTSDDLDTVFIVEVPRG